VRARLFAGRSAAAVADLVEVLRASPARVGPACPHFGPQAERGRICGGCSWQHIAYGEQLRLKTALVTRVVRASVPSAPDARPMLATTPESDPWHFRQKVHFVVASGARGSHALMGHYARSSRRLVPVHDCPVHDAHGNDVAFAIFDACRAAGVRSVKGITVRVGASTSETMATIVVDGLDDKRVRVATRRVLSGNDAPSSVHVNIHPRHDAMVFGPDTRHISGPARLKETVCGLSFLISPTAFFQTNVRGAELLVEQVLSAVPEGASVLDLYAGAGLFALPLARRGHRVVAIEANRGAVADGEASLRLNRLPAERCRFIAQPVEAALEARQWPADVVVLDPPREGCTADVLDRLFAPRRVSTAVYVSCHPESLARDVARIVSSGYAIESLQPVDMFPHTPHVETVAVIGREQGSGTRDREALRRLPATARTSPAGRSTAKAPRR
jgi:23S rRNA (uracil1939-C5)-methyltransferase